MVRSECFEEILRECKLKLCNSSLLWITEVYIEFYISSLQKYEWLILTQTLPWGALLYSSVGGVSNRLANHTYSTTSLYGTLLPIFVNVDTCICNDCVGTLVCSELTMITCLWTLLHQDIYVNCAVVSMTM